MLKKPETNAVYIFKFIDIKVLNAIFLGVFFFPTVAPVVISNLLKKKFVAPKMGFVLK